MSSAAQIWKVPVTPAQRFVLLQLAHADGQKLKGQSGRVFRRFLRAFGVSVILETMDAHPVRPGQPQVNAALASSRAPSLFAITAENLDYVLGLVETERGPAMERTIGPLFDLLAELKAGDAAAPQNRSFLEDSASDYDPAAEDWAPVRTVDPIEVVARQIEAALREAGETRAAELVAAGHWDVPSTNGASRGVPEAASPPAQ